MGDVARERQKITALYISVAYVKQRVIFCRPSNTDFLIIKQKAERILSALCYAIKDLMDLYFCILILQPDQV
jgi:hypothetical protein